MSEAKREERERQERLEKQRKEEKEKEEKEKSFLQKIKDPVLIQKLEEHNREKQLKAKVESDDSLFNVSS